MAAALFWGNVGHRGVGDEGRGERSGEGARREHLPTLVRGLVPLVLSSVHPTPPLPPPRLSLDINTDFLLTVLREFVLPRRPDLKVVLMSATLNAVRATFRARRAQKSGVE